MNTEKQRVAIAESLGWVYHEPTSETGDVEVWCRDNICIRPRELQDYLNSLDACAEFERTLKEDEQAGYACRLIPGSWLPQTGMQVFRIATATPSQRCEAYLRTKGLWI